jgi:pimeloyl-ACP methyl ester carboxylesterase
VAGPDGYDSLKRICHPTLVVNGNNDIVVATLNSYILQQNLPNAELILFPDSNHGSHFQFTQSSNQYLTEFLDR